MDCVARKLYIIAKGVEIELSTQLSLFQEVEKVANKQAYFP